MRGKSARALLMSGHPDTPEQHPHFSRSGLAVLALGGVLTVAWTGFLAWLVLHAITLLL
jgi:hypothetical protein